MSTAPQARPRQARFASVFALLASLTALALTAALALARPSVQQPAPGPDWEQIPTLLADRTLVATFRLTAGSGWALAHAADGATSYAYRLRWRNGAWELREDLVAAGRLTTITVDADGIVLAGDETGVRYRRTQAGWSAAP
jgi:hypothetical protein